MHKISILLCLLIPNVTSAQFKTALIEIDGLTCSMCSYGVQRSIQKLNFVQKVKVDLNTNKASIEFKPTVTVNIKELIKSVVNAGFSVRNLMANFNFTGSKRQEDYLFQNSTFIFLNNHNQNLNGIQEIKFVDKNFTDRNEYKKYKQIIDSKMTHTILKDSYYFVLL